MPHTSVEVVGSAATIELKTGVGFVFKDENDFVCVLQTDKIPTGDNLNTEILRTFQRSPHYFINDEDEQEWRERTYLSDTTFCGEAFGELIMQFHAHKQLVSLVKCAGFNLDKFSPSPHPTDSSPLVGPALGTDESVRLASFLRATSARHMVPTSSGISKSISKPRHQVYLTPFNVRTLKQAGQQTALAHTGLA
ncbi:hypothetical protein T265_11232 [Opisthorchis viverrini]|uniref:Uncharacterized protein n=1 Tax=Opisthorchis viverrini TaxID=6198 RepID=A0A074ZYC5_OPIVI|nr:hypothetical protein T265_11232 [Opisthorchis viverrini]KER20149.1 hypothetical protein T265_11232 [Opisthorchis viverrini]